MLVYIYNIRIGDEKLIRFAGRLFLFAFLISLIACGGHSYEKRVFDIVLNNEGMLRNDAENFQSDSKEITIRGINDITRLKNGFIRYECGNEGILTSSFQYGFYYSPDDVPSGYGAPWTGGVELTEEEYGVSWSWKEINGDNKYYTKKICDNFYYYSASN